MLVSLKLCEREAGHLSFKIKQPPTWIAELDEDYISKSPYLGGEEPIRGIDE